MAWLLRILSLFTPLLRWPVRAWINTHASPSDLSELALDRDKPVCYVLPVASVMDWLALEAVCAERALPRPYLATHGMPSTQRSMVVALPAGRRGERSDLHRIVSRGLHDHSYDVQLVPVSVFWGRNPVKETSLFRILFADSERTGRLRKLLIVLANGHNTLVHFGQPLDYREFVDEAESAAPDLMVRKLVRVLRIHFRRQRAATLGPALSRRSQLINSLLADADVQQAIEDSARREKMSTDAARARARDYANEIAADYSNIAIGFMLRVLTWLWHRIYDGVDVRHLARLRATTHDRREVIYLPSHRSHMDYLLVSYILYKEGLALPQIAAGVNLNFWPVGALLRRCGAFYLRRSFKGDRLYTAVFRAYVDALIQRGQPMKFYPEGGRSRTGRLLSPKTGMLSMAVTSALGGKGAPAAIVPVYIGYDRVMEVNKYFDELRGTRVKKGESMGDLVRGSTQVLKRKYGRVFVSFGEPIDLQAYADTHLPDWRERMPGLDMDARPDWLQDFVAGLAEQVMESINATATLNATGLASLVLLGSPQKAVAEDEMVDTLALLAELARRCPYSRDATAPELTDGRELLAEAEPMMRLVRVPHAWGDVLTVESRQAVLLTYIRNNVMHLFALPSLVANFFAHVESCERQRVLDGAIELYPLLASELFLRWPADQARFALNESIDGLLECGLLSSDGQDRLQRPQAGTREFAALMSLARIMRESLERYAMTVMLLSHNRESGHVERGRFERQCQLMAERMAILTGRNSPEFFDSRLFRNHLQTLVRVGLLHPRGSQLEIDPALRDVAEHALQLLGADLRQSLAHLTSLPQLDDGSDGSASSVETSNAAE
ncbi:glycerol-3-phosphate 1-O-acyltransferase PlsB [uncultured Salinisphaera sp.]|uniref:glycerol-3-phosphate 1-O-acyltransferase PlsB n=1 Tax=uncultured Salinisphaera sp. TaxID=359372 RepID=UPI0032B13BB9|tara:strand:+ start:593 stop:3112 length:2520 start_codon:yes stop_codon:yes gene_type:complete